MPARRLPIGAEIAERGAHVRVWAPGHRTVTLVIESGRAGPAESRAEIALDRAPGGYHAGLVPELIAGARYRFRLGDDPALHVDPASRYQPDGPLGPSQLIDPAAFRWTDAGWTGIAPDRHVLYELHLGTFTPEGTWSAAAAWLGYLAELGITTLELMPVAEFMGRHNWGYDGVNLFAPSHCYGTPDDMRRFVDRAHGAGLAVILDVVYNHLGPAGNPLPAWSPTYEAEQRSEWGTAFNFDGADSGPVRELVVANAAYWIDEFHLDGLRIDATQQIFDRSPEPVLGAIARAARAAGHGRPIFVVGENEPQDTRLLGPPFELDALWNDDFHHSARVAATGVIDGYLHDYRGTAQELVSALKHGFLYQGQLYPWQHNPRGRSTRGVARHRLVHFLENHDQVANIAFGERLCALTDPATLRALTAVLLLGPELPLLFQGQEHGATQPWWFFADHAPPLAAAVRDGRARFVAQFARLATPEAQAALANPTAEATFRGCVLDPGARRFDHPLVTLHRDLIALRRNDPAFTDPRPDALDGAVLADRTFVVRYCQPDPRRDRLLLVNLGPTYASPATAEPLVAPPDSTGWQLVWSSEDPRYGGHGTPPPFDHERLAIPAHAAIVVAPERSPR
ncbi:MAG TPA: malto-oligosyltrehalose trehalohydrolase [Kofleriaceae bacterium]|jgi:maltooligosyltrehalose trehalohydrolase|nr:malto-oligosyltrehalose trehalohydrolase [Kofleriaceae bacterium]